MSLIQKLRNAVSAHPRITTTLAVFGIGLAITAIVGSVIGVFDHSHLANAARDVGGGTFADSGGCC